jgi:two-component system response regulator HydG
VLCVPVSNRSFQSVLYLDSDDPAVQFTEADLHKITAIASVISAATGKFEELEKLLRQNEYFQSEFSLKTNIIGAGSAIRKVLRLVAKIAPSESTVLVTGESGTGKELIARAIHQNSPRADERYVAINCAVLNTPLLESELFGHEKGAFTGAIAQKKGKLELAHRGTLFLDEVAELSVEVQAKLLRFLEEREFGRVGGNNTISVDVRLVAATNKDLREAVKQGLFRQDLFFRLNVVPIQVPPLRERQEDIRKLAEHFLIKHATRCRRNIGGFAPDALRALEAYDWPGNVRELANAIERAVVLGSDDSIQLLDLPESINENPLVLPASSNHFSVRLRLARKKIVLDALAQAGGNYSEAAKLLGILPGNLHRMAKSLRIKEMNRF